MKKAGGTMPYTPLMQDPESKYDMWQAEGVPFARYHYRSAALDEPVRKVVAQERIFKYLEDFQQQIDASEIVAPSIESAIVAAVSEEVTDKMKVAFSKRDKESLVTAIEELIKQGPPDQESKAKIAVLKEVLSKMVGPGSSGTERADFLVEAIKPLLPEGLQSIATQTISNIRDAQAGRVDSNRQSEEMVTNTIIPGALTTAQMDECSCTIVRARSADEDWSKTIGVMGAHPGVMFGCHTAACSEFLGFDRNHGIPEEFHEAFMPVHIDFNKRYPKRPGFWYDTYRKTDNDTIEW